MTPEDQIEQVEELQQILINRVASRSEPADPSRYSELRRELIQSARVRPVLPDFIAECRTLEHAYSRVRDQADDSRTTSQKKRVWKSFKTPLDTLERNLIAPADFEITGTLENVESNQVTGAWKKALDRRTSDPEGAITMARNLLESVCKHLLDQLGKPYDRGDDLPSLYHSVAQELNLAPGQHTEELFSRILGSAQQVVEGLGAIRNRHGDAHGDSNPAGKPAERHAELAVNLAGSTATFLIKTYRSSTQQASVGGSEA